MDKDYIVTKSNKLIYANYNLSVQEQKIVLTLASMVQPHDTEFKPYQFKIKDFIKLLEIKDKSKYSEVPQITKNLMKKVFEIREGNEILQLAWLSSAKYKLKEGIVVLKFAPELKPYMLQLKELYTSYKLKNILSLKSKYAIRLYELLKSNLFKKHVTITVEDIKQHVGAVESAYDRYNNFKNRVLIKSQSELNEKTDIKFKFEEIKTGRKVTSIKFTISSNELINKLPKEEKTDSQIKAVQDIFTKHSITPLEASCILKDAKENIDLIKQCYEYALKKNIDNIVGYVRTIVKHFNKPQENKAGTFNNFKQRKYDFKELEKKLLGWD